MISTQNLFHRLVATLLVLVATFSTALADESGTGWSYNSSTNTLTLSGDNVDWPAMKVFSASTENVVFADDYSVASIPQEAFRGFSKLTAIDIPDVVTSIGKFAFYGCTSLASISLPEGLTSIGDGAFCGCTSLGSVKILSDGTSDNKHFVYLGSESDKNATGSNVFPQNQATLVYDPATTWIGDDETQNLHYYFNSFATPTSIHSNTIPTSAPQYYDLSGRPISPTNHKGIAVKLQDGNSSLISIK